MPWTVQITGEQGDVREETICHGTYFASAKRSRLLKYIDPWGDTTFNNQQMSDFLQDWTECEEIAKFQSTQEIWGPAVYDEWKAVKVLAEKVRNEVHLYLKFVGD